MRRLFLSVVSLGLLGMSLGCQPCTHGVCDCDKTGPCGTYGSCANCPGYGHGELNFTHGLVGQDAPPIAAPLPSVTPVAPATPEPPPAPAPAPTNSKL